ncbi:hypothetical protein N7462_004026 [Penicillium macrosclerotiorum]|uniref:uncharacterized protein n=1 Tax=Penicillium macrosclerotiorum TaxID=303699 RepID=UPI002546BEAB|nr:uncharacterized protein N7462_004026 [Penicillium macrosclerotiorum]KAJ5689634.1 hypothetical protein N7462_004026 [Penicillium macrosclerotiorum]
MTKIGLSYVKSINAATAHLRFFSKIPALRIENRPEAKCARPSSSGNQHHLTIQEDIYRLDDAFIHKNCTNVRAAKQSLPNYKDIGATHSESGQDVEMDFRNMSDASTF